MANYIDSAEIQKTLKADRWAELSADANAVTFAVDKTNAEIESLITKTYADVASTPEIVRKLGGVIGRYWLYNFHELVDDDSHIYKDCIDARKALRDISAGMLTGINDPADDTDDPVRQESYTRRFNNEQWQGGV